MSARAAALVKLAAAMRLLKPHPDSLALAMDTDDLCALAEYVTDSATPEPMGLTCQCCGKLVQARIAGFTLEKLIEYLANYHCPGCRTVEEHELQAVELDGLQ